MSKVGDLVEVDAGDWIVHIGKGGFSMLRLVASHPATSSARPNSIYPHDGVHYVRGVGVMRSGLMSRIRIAMAILFGHESDGIPFEEWWASNRPPWQ